uniref:Adipose-secreted signaling protein n=1 Tax=Eptatretus burgeri TaxID=7764 RepID=A0A8C4N636_EPTBU
TLPTRLKRKCCCLGTFYRPSLPCPSRCLPFPSYHSDNEGFSVSCPAGHVLCCLYTAHKEGVLQEDVIISNNTDDEVCVKVSLHARVMGRLQGTPMLLDGVRCVGVLAEYDSEQSDWHGFD